MKINCLNCNKEFELSPAFVKRGRRCCSLICRSEIRRKLSKELKCEFCHKIFPNKQSQNAKYCSKECYVNWMKGKPSIPNLLGKRGIKPRTYHLRKRPFHGGVVYDEWRMSVWKRDNFICQDCKKSANELKKLNIKIHADHIKPYCNYPDLRYELSNGRTLCADCHKQTETYGSRARFY